MTNKVCVLFLQPDTWYDGHSIMQETFNFNENLNVITNNIENYMAFRIQKSLAFIDNMQLMNVNLKSLIKKLPEGNLSILLKNFKEVIWNQSNKKNINHMNTYVSDEDNNHTKKVWNESKVKAKITK